MTDMRPPSEDICSPGGGITRRVEGPLSHVPPGGALPVAAPFSAASAEGVLAVIWRSRWIMLICTLAALAGGAVYIQTATPIYTSTARLYLDYAGLRLSNPYEPGGSPQTDKYLYTQAELITSQPVLASAIEELTPQRLRTFSNVDVPIAYLKQEIGIGVGKKDETISVAFPSAYPAEAAQIVNGIVAAYLASKSKHEQRNSQQVLENLQAATIAAKEELDKKRDQLVQFQEHSNVPLLLGSDQNGKLLHEYLLTFQNAYAEAQIKAVKAEEFYRGVQALAKDPVALRQYVRIRQDINADTGEDSQRAPLEAKVVDLELQKQTSLEDVTPDHPKVVKLSAEAQRVEAKLSELDDRFVKAVTAAAERQYVEARKYEERYAQFYNEQQERLAKLGAEIEQCARLRLEVSELTTYWQDRQRDVRKITEIVGEDIGQLRMAILEPAQPAGTPSRPQKARTMAFVLVLGLVLGAGVAVVKDSLNQTLRSADEVAALLHLPVLGVVPEMSRRDSVRERGQKVALQPESHEAEAFRTIRTAVFFGAPKDRAKTLLITSPTADDGKSTLASNLAIAMARAGQKTLILDTDFRKPIQHIIFGLDDSEQCLSSVFTGRVKLAAAIQRTDIKGLHVLPCGRGISSPAEVLNSQRFARLLWNLAAVYDRIVVDTPPVTVVTDAQIIGALCDVSVLVLRTDRVTRKAAQRARDALDSVGACLLGVVVNEVRKTADRHGYYRGPYRGSSGPDAGGSQDDATETRLDVQTPPAMLVSERAP